MAATKFETQTETFLHDSLREVGAQAVEMLRSVDGAWQCAQSRVHTFSDRVSVFHVLDASNQVMTTYREARITVDVLVDGVATAWRVSVSKRGFVTVTNKKSKKG